jgi:mono/diheme cytochrome c family protein
MNKKNTLIVGMAILLFLVLCRIPFAQTVLPEDPTKGARLFATKGCVKCHALRGDGGKGGPDLGKVDLGDSQLQLASSLLNHIPSMTQDMERTRVLKPNLTGDELNEISAYLYFLKFFDEPGNASQGRYIFQGKNCYLCHPLSGRGPEGDPGLDQFPQNISPIFLSQTLWNHGPAMIARMVKLGITWPSFRGTEMMDLLEYIKISAKGPRESALIAPGNPRQGKQVFTAKGCIRCHTVGREGGKNAEDLGSRARVFYTSLTQIVSIMWDKGPLVLAKMAQTQKGIPRFTSKEMADLLSYLYFLHFIDPPGNPKRGEGIFTEWGCASCHSVNGKKGELMQVDLSKYRKGTNPLEMVGGMWNHSTEIGKAMRDKGIPWPRFRKGELADLIEFVRTAK